MQRSWHTPALSSVRAVCSTSVPTLIQLAHRPQPHSTIGRLIRISMWRRVHTPEQQ